MKYIAQLKKYEFIRFLIIGTLNTFVNFFTLNFVYFVLGKSMVVSGVIAICVAVTFSFVLNRTFVFNDTRHPIIPFILFISFSVFGVLIIQNTVYVSMLYILSHSNWSNDFMSINFANIVASVFVMIWNYTTYRIIVFNDRSHPDK